MNKRELAGKIFKILDIEYNMLDRLSETDFEDIIKNIKIESQKDIISTNTILIGASNE